MASTQQIIYAKDPSELSLFLSQLHDTCRVGRDETFTARISTQWGVRILAGKVPARMDHRDTTHLIGEKYIKLKP